jgi:hypothetical protein
VRINVFQCDLIQHDLALEEVKQTDVGSQRTCIEQCICLLVFNVNILDIYCFKKLKIDFAD